MNWNLIQRHELAIILALCTALLVAFPQVYFRIDHRNDGVYQGIELLPDSPWSPRVREVQDGHPSFGSIYYKDGKDNPYLFQPLGSMVVAYMGEAFSLDINNTLLLSRFVLPFVVFLLIYGFVLLVSGDMLAALCSATVLLIAEPVLSFSGMTQLAHGTNPGSFLQLARPVNPVMIYILLFSFLISFWLFYKKRDWRWGIASAVLLGLNFYDYFYSWTALYAFGGVLVFILLIQKKWKEALRTASVFVGALLVAIPYGINLYHASLFPTYAEVSPRFGMVATHAPLFVGFLVIGAVVVFLFGFPREDREKYLFGLALLLVPFITMNQQLITGKVMQAAHYHWFFHKPIAVIFILVTLFHLLVRWGLDSYKKTFTALILVASIAIGAFVQVDSYYHDTRDGGLVAIERQKYGPVMQWLNENAQKEEVVLSNDEISHLTVIYTSLNVFYHRAAPYSLSAPKERLLDVLFTFYRFRGVGSKDAHDIFFAERGDISANIYGIYYRELSGSYEAIPDEKIEEIIALYQQTLSVPTSVWLARTLAKYEVNYLVWDKKANPLWNVDRFAFLKKEAELGDIAIYRFNPQ